MTLRSRFFLTFAVAAQLLARQKSAKIKKTAALPIRNGNGSLKSRPTSLPAGFGPFGADGLRVCFPPLTDLVQENDFPGGDAQAMPHFAVCVVPLGHGQTAFAVDAITLSCGGDGGGNLFEAGRAYPLSHILAGGHNDTQPATRRRCEPRAPALIREARNLVKLRSGS